MKFMSNKKFTGAIQPGVVYLGYIIPDLPPLLYGIIWDMSIHKSVHNGSNKKNIFLFLPYFCHIYILGLSYESKKGVKYGTK